MYVQYMYMYCTCLTQGGYERSGRQLARKRGDDSHPLLPWGKRGPLLRPLRPL